MNLLVTGGAGYIGSHVVRLLLNRGDQVVIVDDFSTGLRSRVPDVPVIEVDLSDTAAVPVLAKLMNEFGITGVIHFAAKKRVDESVEKPLMYFQQNINSLANVLKAMQLAKVENIVFSSSAAVYGDVDGIVTEDAPLLPINPYGQTKLIGEWLLNDTAESSNIRGVSLRYFNVAGCGWEDLADTAVLNLVPMVFEKLDNNQQPLIFGSDYPTNDGTCERDFIHVMDLAEAHLAAIDGASTLPHRHTALNVGTGRSTSVKSMIDLIIQESGQETTPLNVARRSGDPASVVADASLIKDLLDWKSSFSVEEIVSSAWAAHNSKTN